MLTVRPPRVDDRRRDEAGRRQRFTSTILLPYMRRSPKVAEVLPVLYLRGLSTGDFQEALPVLLGEEAKGLPPTTITRLTAAWQADYDAFRKRDLSDRDYVYVWADGVHFNIRLDDERLCTLVLVGARPDGTKEVIAVEDGFRESKESWPTLLRERATKGAGSRTKGLLMAYKLLDMAEKSWRRLNGAELLPQVRRGERVLNGIRQEREAHVTQPTQVKSKKVRRPAA